MYNTQAAEGKNRGQAASKEILRGLKKYLTEYGN